MQPSPGWRQTYYVAKDDPELLSSCLYVPRVGTTGVHAMPGLCWGRSLGLDARYTIILPCKLQAYDWFLCLIRKSLGFGEMAQLLRVLAALPEDSSLILSTHTVAHNY